VGESLRGDIWPHGPELVEVTWRTNPHEDDIPVTMELVRMEDVFGVRPEPGERIAVNIQQWFGGIDIDPDAQVTVIVPRGSGAREAASDKPFMRGKYVSHGEHRRYKTYSACTIVQGTFEYCTFDEVCAIDSGNFEYCVFVGAHLRGGVFSHCTFSDCVVKGHIVMDEKCLMVAG
jgi:hypothetical protein